MVSAIILIPISGPNIRYTSTGYDFLPGENYGLPIVTNAFTTEIIAYKLWQVTLDVIYLIQSLIMGPNDRTHRTTVVKNLGLKGWRGPAQNILIILVESGLAYLVLQVRLPRLTHLVQLIVQWTGCGLDSGH